MTDFENMKKNEEKDKKKYTTMNLRIPTTLINDVDQFTEEYNFMNRTDAVRFLISKGLKDFQPNK